MLPQLAPRVKHSRLDRIHGTVRDRRNFLVRQPDVEHQLHRETLRGLLHRIIRRTTDDEAAADLVWAMRWVEMDLDRVVRNCFEIPEYDPGTDFPRRILPIPVLCGWQGPE